MLPIYSWVWGYLPTKATVKRKQTLPQPRKSYHISVAPQLGIGGSWAPSNALLKYWLPWSCVGNHSCQELINSAPLSGSEETYSLVCSSYSLSAHFLMMFSEPWVGLCIATPFVTEYLADIYFSREIFILYCYYFLKGQICYLHMLVQLCNH